MAVMTPTALVLVVLLPVSAWAQDSAGTPESSDPGISLSVSADVVSTYMFRGIRQNSTGLALWPVVDVGLKVYSAAGRVKNVTVDVGSWNSLHTGDTGANGPTGRPWYESDVYATVNVSFAGAVTVGSTYTAYTSPNDSFTTVRELSFRMAVADRPRLGSTALNPYALVAFELDASPGTGQADGGSKAGRYLEIGMAPAFAAPRASIAVPVKVGLSVGHYYERQIGNAAMPAYLDPVFGYFSAAAVITVPLTGRTGFGTWNLHGGLEYQALGDTTRALSGGNRSRAIASAGVGFTY